MANNKDFILKNPVEVGGPTNVTLGTVTSNNIDLSTGNYFADTPSGASTYTISNAGAVQSFQLEVTGGTAEVAQNFSTTLYTGNGSTQTITNGIDLAGDGGMVWTKGRSSGTNHHIVDTERGVGDTLFPNTTGAEFNMDSVTGFLGSGFTLGNNANSNSNGNDYVSWTFKKEPSFFDVVTYTGDGTNGRQISHNLGSVPGMILIKRTNSSDDWRVFHRSESNKYAALNTTFQFQTDGGNIFGNPSNGTATAPTSTNFTVANDASVNGNGSTYVAYLFAHDTDASSLIKCGSYTGNGSTTGPVIDLGFEPQWLMVKRSDSADEWFIFDVIRGFDLTTTARLSADSSNAESPSLSVIPTSTGFQPVKNHGSVNGSGGTYIYVAIRAASDLDITWPSSIEWTGGSAPSSPATGETDVFTLSTDDGGTSYVGIKTADNLS